MRRSRPSLLPVALAGVTVATASLGTLGVGTALAATRAVEVRDFAYAPAAIEIAAGDTVRWSWLGEARHSVTAPGSFDSHPECTALTPEACGTTGHTFAWTAEQPGTIEYRCKLHPDRMQGTITITAAAPPSPSPAPPPSPSPSARPSPSPSPRPSPSPTPPPPSSPAPPPAEEPDAPSSPSPPPSPRPSPTRGVASGFGVGEATEVPVSPLPDDGAGPDVAPPLVSDASPVPLEPFPAPPSPSLSSPAPVEGDVVAVGPAGGAGRDLARAAGVLAVAVTLLTFGRVVLFGRPWTEGGEGRVR